MLMSQKCKLDICAEKNLITDVFNGEVFCGDCGTILEEKLTNNNGVHTYNLQDFMSQSRTGPKQSLAMHDGGMYSIIGNDKDFAGKQLSLNTKNHFRRLKVLDSRSKTRKSSERTLIKSLIFLNGLKEKLGISDNTVEVTCLLYRKIQNRQLIKGRIANALMAASLYISCRQTMTPRSLDDIAKNANISKKIFQKSVRFLIDEFGLKLPQYNTSAFLTKLANNMEICEKTKRYALHILDDVEKSGISAGKNPLGQAAASLYLASMLMGDDISQSKFCEFSGVSTVTLRNRKNTIQKLLEL